MDFIVMLRIFDVNYMLRAIKILKNLLAPLILKS